MAITVGPTHQAQLSMDPLQGAQELVPNLAAGVAAGGAKLHGGAVAQGEAQRETSGFSIVINSDF